jgi:YidC/Oxa1 family membrane protein insertase
MQGGDPAQQKMMMYFMPGMFTVLMLFLPAGLGVYMFTNSLLAISQQWLVQTYTMKPASASGGDIEVSVRDEGSKKKKNKRKNGSKAA